VAASSALQGLRVLDLSRVLAGPWATQLLADLGAEVIKIERPGVGDDTRSWGPPMQPSSTRDGVEQSAYFLSTNRGKRSVAIDISTAEGADIVRSLVAVSDVVIENFKVDGLVAFGLDAASLIAAHPSLVVCSITGFGQQGPLSHLPGYDMVVQAMSGLMSVTGQPDGTPGGEPMKAGVALMDVMCGLYASSAILAAVIESQRTGMGTHIDVSLLDVGIATLANQALSYLVSGNEPRRLGNSHPTIAPYQPFDSADGPLVIAVGNDQQFRSLVALLGVGDMADDARFSTNAARVSHRSELLAAIEPLIKGHERESLLVKLTAGGIPAGPIRSVSQALTDDHATARGVVINLESEAMGTVPSVAQPFAMNIAGATHGSANIASPLAPPTLGEHTAEVLGDVLGMDPPAIAALFQRGIVA